MDQFNWARNYKYQASQIAQPISIEELQELVCASSKVRALGSRHSFNDLPDTSGLLITTSRLPTIFQLDEQSSAVTVSGAMTYGDLAVRLQKAGWALHNLASLPHISIAGAISTATHGSGDRNGNLATAVRGLRILRADGEIVALRRGEPDFTGAVVSLGALGFVIDVTLDIEPTFDMIQRVFTGVSWSVLAKKFDELTSAAYSVSLFTNWNETQIRYAWVKERIGSQRTVGSTFFNARAVTVPVHMIEAMNANNTSQQLGLPGPWSERLAHFRFEFTPSNGAEIQSEYLVPRVNVAPAIEAVRTLADRIAPLLLISEIRTVAKDDLWLSSSFETDVVGFHFTWVRDQAAVEKVLPELEKLFFALAARPHWGKLFIDQDNIVPTLYPRMAEFRNLIKKFDPNEVFTNSFIARIIKG